ncbi:MAG: hypothetical protein GY796_07750 [Chloroflexi bacterium]|nr:hypothetical protein [Chloroflexota bacterium]
MENTVSIVNVVVKPGLSPVGKCVLVGLELSNGRTAWGECAHVPHLQSARQIIQQQIAPLLQDQSPDTFINLVAQVDGLTETVTTTRIIQPVSESSASGATLSRRRLITGLLTEDKPKTEDVVEERPLSAAFRFGISQAIFNAVAISQNKTLLTVLLEAYDLPVPDTAVPLHVEANAPNMSLVQPVLPTAVASIGYSVGSTNYKLTFGNNAERLQAHVRQMKEWLTAVASNTCPTIHLNIQGGFSELYDNDEGKILGALYGLEQTAKPYSLVVENVALGEVTAVIQILKTVQSYLQTRQMGVKLAAGYTLFSADELRVLGEETAVQQIHLSPAQFGSICQTISFILDCRERGIGVVVHGEGGVVDVVTAVALSTQAHALSGPPDRLFNMLLTCL